MALTIQDLALNYLDTRSDKDFTLLYKRIYPGLRNNSKKFLESIFKSRSELEEKVDDVLSRVFLNILEKIDQYNSIWNFSTWVYAILKNELIQEKRLVLKTVVMSQIASYADDDNVAESSTNYMLRNAIHPEDLLVNSHDISMEELEQEQKISQVYNIALAEMKKLPEIHKNAIIDREVNGLKYKEIADKEGVSIDTIKTRIRVGRTKLKSNILRKAPDAGKILDSF